MLGNRAGGYDRYVDYPDRAVVFLPLLVENSPIPAQRSKLRRDDVKKIALFALMLTLSLGAWAQNGAGNGDDSNDNGNGNANANHGKPSQTPADIATAEVKFLTALLDLSTAQQASATTLFTAEETQKATIETDLDAQHKALTAALTATPTGDITTPINKIGADTIALESLEVNTELTFFGQLTTDQKIKYANFLKGDFLVPGQGSGHGHGPGRSGHSH